MNFDFEFFCCKENEGKAESVAYHEHGVAVCLQ